MDALILCWEGYYVKELFKSLGLLTCITGCELIELIYCNTGTLLLFELSLTEISDFMWFLR